MVVPVFHICTDSTVELVETGNKDAWRIIVAVTVRSRTKCCLVVTDDLEVEPMTRSGTDNLGRS